MASTARGWRLCHRDGDRRGPRPPRMSAPKERGLQGAVGGTTTASLPPALAAGSVWRLGFRVAVGTTWEQLPENGGDPPRPTRRGKRPKRELFTFSPPLVTPPKPLRSQRSQVRILPRVLRFIRAAGRISRVGREGSEGSATTGAPRGAGRGGGTGRPTGFWAAGRKGRRLISKSPDPSGGRHTPTGMAMNSSGTTEGGPERTTSPSH